MTHHLADAIYEASRRVIREELGNVVSPFLYGQWDSAETVDANLSKVTLTDGSTARFVPKLASVTGLSFGQTVLCVKGKGVPLTIVGRVIGDITLAAFDDDIE